MTEQEKRAVGRAVTSLCQVIEMLTPHVKDDAVLLKAVPLMHHAKNEMNKII